MPNQIELKDAQQDQEIALLKHRVEQLENEGPSSDAEIIKELRERVRKLERTVWSAAAVVSAAITVIGIAIAAEARPANALVEGSLTSEPCATHEVASVVVKEVSIKEEKSNAETN